MNENTLSVMVERYTGVTLMADTVDVEFSLTENGEIFNDDQNHSKKIFWWYEGLNSGPCTCALTLELNLKPFFSFKRLFSIGSHVVAWAGLDCSPPTYASHITRNTGDSYYTQLVY
jgi:hypothetical protein